MKFFALFLVSLLFLSPAVAEGRRSCQPHERAVKTLTEKYGEVKVVSGLSGQTVIEIYHNKEKNTFSIVTRHLPNTSCLAVAGTDLHFVKDPKLPKAGTKM